VASPELLDLLEIKLREELYPRLLPRSALRTIARGPYVNNRVFFADEDTALAIDVSDRASRVRSSQTERAARWRLHDSVLRVLRQHRRRCHADRDR
jgi:hypothetical protein